MEMVHPENDDLVHYYLDKLGIDTNKAVEYRAYQHRNLQGQVVVNFLVSGDLKMDRASLTGPFSSYEDRLIAASLTDRSLFEELHSISNRCNDYAAHNVVDKNNPLRDTPVSDEEAAIVQQIEQLEAVLYHIRGSQFKNDGSIKLPIDYKKPNEPEQKRLRRRSIKKQQGE